MNFKKRSEMCKLEDLMAGAVFSGSIRGGTVFYGRPVYCDRGIFTKVHNAHGGFVRLAYFSESRCDGYHFDDCEIRDYKELNVTLVDEDA